MTTTDPVLIRFRKALEETYGSRLERAVLFGSRARGDARPESDYDVAVFLRDLTDRDAELDRLAPIQSRIIDETDGVIHVLPFPAEAWAKREPLMRTIRAEGREL
jgi:predicted nucleotidyltransferase